MKRLLAVFLALVMGLMPLSAMATWNNNYEGNFDIDINVNLPEMDLGGILNPDDLENILKPDGFEDFWGDAENPWEDFTDLDPTQWYWEAVAYCLENGLMEGMDNGLFFPNAKTTRAQLVTILWRLEGSPWADKGDLTFDDVKVYAWYADAVAWASSEGIVQGFSSETFGPNENVTREQLVTILYRYAQEKDYDTTIHLLPSILQYKDADQISDWALQAMQWAVGAKILSGTDDVTLSPGEKATRAQIASVFYRFSQDIVN